MAAPAWLTAKPIAHRGLHDRKAGILENTLGAARAAVDHGFGIECDVQLTRDGEAVVFHDFTLDRLTEASGPVVARTAAELAALPMKGTADRIPTLADLLSAIGGRVPLVCEIKSAFDGDLRLTRRTAEVLASYAGPVVLESFDPAIVEALIDLTDRPRGYVGENDYRDGEWEQLTPQFRHEMRNMLHFERMKPDFLSWQVKDLDTAVPFLARKGLGLPVTTWTVRTPEHRARAAEWADQIVFEGFVP